MSLLLGLLDSIILSADLDGRTWKADSFVSFFLVALSNIFASFFFPLLQISFGNLRFLRRWGFPLGLWALANWILMICDKQSSRSCLVVRQPHTCLCIVLMLRVPVFGVKGKYVALPVRVLESLDFLQICFWGLDGLGS